jgi:hypothetical protein
MFSGFGATTPAPATSSFGFGSGNKVATSTGFAFGATTATPFASSNQPSNQQRPATGFSFGSQPTAPTGSVLNTGQSPGFGGFGTAQAKTNPFGSPGAFGQQPAATGFGTPGAFGQQQTAGAFGAPTTSTFGQPTTSTFGQQQPSLSFGGTTMGAFGQPANTQSSVFGRPATGFGLPSSTQPGFTSMPVQPNYGIFTDPIREIKKRYAPFVDGFGNPLLKPTDMSCRPNVDCKFVAINYRKFEDSSNQINPQLLDIARNEEVDQNNPDPEKYFAVREYGISQLQTRFDNQTAATTKHKESLKDLQEIIDSVEKKNNQMIARYEGLRSNYFLLQLSLLRILRKIEVLRQYQSPLDKSEIIYREKLEKLILSFQEPSKRLHELMVMDKQIEKKKEAYVEAISEEDMQTLFNLLDQQRQGIEVLSNLLM